jgi:hypothetical protein
MTDDPHLIDPDYDKHGGFPNFEAAEPGPGFARFLTAMRRAQDLAVSADPDSDTWDLAADRAEELVKLLGPFEAPERADDQIAARAAIARSTLKPRRRHADTDRKGFGLAAGT